MSSPAEAQLLERLAAGVGVGIERLSFLGSGALVSYYPVSALAAASIAVAGLAAAEVRSAVGLPASGVVVDRALADSWFGLALRPIGWKPPSPWDAIAGDYRALHEGTTDGWIRLHTNAPHQRAAALRVLGVAADRDAVAAAVASWVAGDLEAAVVAEGGCAAELRSAAEWATHPQGAAVAAEPLVHRERTGAFGDGEPSAWAPTADRPLAGVRVLDLTRVLAGPVATRLLAGLGADVLRVDPPGWDEPHLVPEGTVGKRSARLDAQNPGDRDRMLELLAGADVLVSGYRPDALEKLGFGDAVRRRIRPGLVDVSLDAYGHTGPWAGRRGFDSLLQMSSGIADAGLRDGTAQGPTPLPVQALDQATGYLVGAAVLHGLASRARDGLGTRSLLSLARTAVELEAARGLAVDAPAPALDTVDAAAPAPGPEVTPFSTPWGDAELLPAPVTIDGVRPSWALPPRPLGSDDARWA